MTSISFVLSWDPPVYEGQNGEIIHYIINVLVQETGESVNLESTSTQLNIANLKPYRTHNCEVSAATSIGLGPFSSNVTVITLETGNSH